MCATDLFPGFDDKQLRDIGLWADQVVSIDALCQNDLHGSCQASTEYDAESPTRIATETTWPIEPEVQTVSRYLAAETRAERCFSRITF